MNKRHHYNQLVEGKLEQLPGADTDQLWDGMQAILDEKMPQKKERRRFVPWLLDTKGLLLLSAVSLITISGFSLFYLSARENSTTKRNLHNSTDGSTIVKDETAMASRDMNDNHSVRISETPTQNSKLRINLVTASIIVENKNTQRHLLSQIARGVTAINMNSAQQNSFDNLVITNDNSQEKEAVSIAMTPLFPDQMSFQIGKTSDLINEHSLSANFLQQSTSVNQQKEKHSSERASGNDEKGWYAGIVSGLDLSSIHMKSLKTGVTRGLIVGYSVNSNWSMESGLLWDNKKFHDDGSHFSPAGYTPTSNVTIVAVNGKSRLYEWPINVKYVIPQHHNLFATAGISSYFMRLENYDYEYTQTNQPGGHNYLSYKNASRNWFSVANMSVGYTHTLGGVGSLRVEPYVKLPLKNLGVGKMPIMSTGLNIGFTRALTR